MCQVLEGSPPSTQRLQACRRNCQALSGCHTTRNSHSSHSHLSLCALAGRIPITVKQWPPASAVSKPEACVHELQRNTIYGGAFLQANTVQTLRPAASLGTSPLPVPWVRLALPEIGETRCLFESSPFLSLLWSLCHVLSKAASIPAVAGLS